MNRTVFLLLLTLSLSPIATADVITIDFDSDPLGIVANGFVSADAPGVYFYAPSGISLRIYSGSETDSNALLLGSDDGSALEIRFDFPVFSLSLDFGNDDPVWHPSPDWASLTLFSDGAEVAQVALQANHDDLVNQTITYTGSAFNAVTFRYVDAGINGIGLAELIDNVTFNDSVLVPLPASSALLGLAICLLGYSRAGKPGGAASTQRAEQPPWIG